MRGRHYGLIGRYDQAGAYSIASDRADPAFLRGSGGAGRRRDGSTREAAEIVREASQRLFAQHPELLLSPGRQRLHHPPGWSLACATLDYFLRYAATRWLPGKKKKKKKKNPPQPPKLLSSWFHRVGLITD